MLGSTSLHLHSTWLLLSLSFFFEDSPEDDDAAGVCRQDMWGHWQHVAAGRGHATGPSTTWKQTFWYADIKSNQGTCSCGRMTPVSRVLCPLGKYTIPNYPNSLFRKFKHNRLSPINFSFLFWNKSKSYSDISLRIFLCLQKKMIQCRYNTVTKVTDLIWLWTTPG